MRFLVIGYTRRVPSSRCIARCETEKDAKRLARFFSTFYPLTWVQKNETLPDAKAS